MLCGPKIDHQANFLDCMIEGSGIPAVCPKVAAVVRRRLAPAFPASKARQLDRERLAE